MSERPKPPAKTAEVLDILKQRAKDMRTIAYSEIAEETGLASPGVGTPLGYIRDHVCRAQGLPWLNALAVNKETRRPGDKFLPDGTTVEDDHWWRGMVTQVYAYDWSEIEIEEQ